MLPDFISGHVKYYEGVYCLLQINFTLLKKITYHTTWPKLWAQGKGLSSLPKPLLVAIPSHCQCHLFTYTLSRTELFLHQHQSAIPKPDLQQRYSSAVVSVSETRQNKKLAFVTLHVFAVLHWQKQEAQQLLRNRVAAMHFFAAKLLSIAVMTYSYACHLRNIHPTGNLLRTQLINFSMRRHWQHVRMTRDSTVIWCLFSREPLRIPANYINLILPETGVPELHDSSNSIGLSVFTNIFSWLLKIIA